MKTPLTHALRDGRLVSIHQAPSGLACDCVCPACLQPLIARKGRKMTHHFAHQRGEECPFGVETMVHQLAKQILATEKQIMLPAVRVGAFPAAIFPAQPFGFDHVWLEHRLHDIIPDLYVQQGRRRLLIEIACTHPCPPVKQKKIIGLGIAAMEVSLSGLIARLEKNGQPLAEEELRKELIFASENRRWLFNPKKNALELALQRRSERRKVKRIGRNKKATLCVHPCPERKRRWKTGALKGQSYAQVYRDCLHCPYCLRIDYREELRAYRWAPTQPERVFCWAGEKEWMEQFVYPLED